MLKTIATTKKAELRDKAVHIAGATRDLAVDVADKMGVEALPVIAELEARVSELQRDIQALTEAGSEKDEVHRMALVVKQEEVEGLREQLEQSSVSRSELLAQVSSLQTAVDSRPVEGVSSLLDRADPTEFASIVA